MSTTVNNNSVHKTIYSIAPNYYVEPRSAAFTGFTYANTSGSYNNGWYFYCSPNGTGNTIYCPISGYRDGSNSYISQVGVWGHYWTSGSDPNTSYARSFAYNSSGAMYPTNEDVRYHGFDMRPISE